MLENIPLPNSIKFEKTDNPNITKVLIEPFYVGYGVTIGNTLRRVLLSSLPGAAIIGVNVKGVDHEFTSIDYIKEDVVDIILNLKKVAVKSHSEEPVKMTLNVTGKKVVTAGDFEGTSDVEVVNPDQYICEISDDAGTLEMEVICDQGRGYVAVEQREKEQLEAGMIVVDAVYSPILNVSIDVDNVRVGQRTDYDRVTLTIETDGSITVEEAIHRSSTILKDHYDFITEGETVSDTTRESIEEVVPLQDVPVEGINDIEQKEESLEEVIEVPKRKRGRPRKSETLKELVEEVKEEATNTTEE